HDPTAKTIPRAMTVVTSAHPIIAICADSLPGIGCRLLDGGMVVEIARAFTQQKKVFVRLRTAVLDALGHRVWLRPDDVLAQIPTVGAQGESNGPWDADQVFRFQAGGNFRHHYLRTMRIWYVNFLLPTVF